MKKYKYFTSYATLSNEETGKEVRLKYCTVCGRLTEKDYGYTLGVKIKGFFQEYSLGGVGICEKCEKIMHDYILAASSLLDKGFNYARLYKENEETIEAYNEELIQKKIEKLEVTHGNTV